MTGLKTMESIPIRMHRSTVSGKVSAVSAIILILGLPLKNPSASRDRIWTVLSHP